MSRLMNHEHHSQLMLLRGNVAASVLANDADATQRSYGMVQGYLLGLYAANEIDFGDVQALEDEVTDAEMMKRNTIHNLPEELKEVLQLKGALNRRITCHERNARRKPA